MFPMMLFFFFYLVGRFKYPVCLANIVMLMFDMSKVWPADMFLEKVWSPGMFLDWSQMSNIGCLMSDVCF